MARVLTRVARKDYPEAGIKKGETYYKVSLKTGPRSSRTLKSKTPFKRHQLTTSEYLSRVYILADETIPAINEPADLQAIKDELEELKAELDEKLENMPEGLKQGPTGQTLEERMGECDDFIDTLEGIEFEEEEDWDAESSEHETYDDYRQSIIEEIQGSCPF